jgi:hypothetical protein
MQFDIDTQLQKKFKKYLSLIFKDLGIKHNTLGGVSQFALLKVSLIRIPTSQKWMLKFGEILTSKTFYTINLVFIIWLTNYFSIQIYQVT